MYDDVYVENKDYIHSLFDPLKKKVNINEIYLNALLKHQTELENKINNLEKQIIKLQETQTKIVPWYKKIFKI